MERLARHCSDRAPTVPSSAWLPSQSHKNQACSPVRLRHRRSVSRVTKPTLPLRSTDRLCSRSSSKNQRKPYSCRVSRGSSQRSNLASMRPISGQEAQPLLPHLQLFAKERKRPTTNILAMMMSAPSAQPAKPRGLSRTNAVARERNGKSTSKIR